MANAEGARRTGESSRPATRPARVRVLAAGLAVAGLFLALHGGVLGWPFVSDDYIFLFEVRTQSLSELALALDPGQHYYRPLGRELYFAAVAGAFGLDPLAFRLVNLGLLLATAAGIAAVGARLGGLRAGLFAAVVYALAYFHAVLWGWISAAQDVLSAGLGVAAVRLFLGGRGLLAAAALFFALFAKESVAPLPLALTAWVAWRERTAGFGRAWTRGALATRALWGAVLAWFVVILGIRLRTRTWTTDAGDLPVADVSLAPGDLWEGLRTGLLTHVYLDQPPALLAEAARQISLPWVPLILAALAGFAIGRRGRAASADAAPRGEGGLVSLGLFWLATATVPLALVGHHYSAYYASFAAAGFALLAGRGLARVPWPLASAVLALAVLGNQVANRVERYKTEIGQPETAGWSSITRTRLEREAAFLDSLRLALDRRPPDRGASIYVSNAPFMFYLATAGDHAPRVWFDDPDLSIDFSHTYDPARDAGPARFLRYEREGGAFVALPESLMVLSVRGEQALAAGRAAEARASLESALEYARPGAHDPERVELENTLGLASFQTGDTAAARAAWRRALAVDPSHRGALLNLAAFDAGLGRFGQAMRWIERLLEAEPRDRVALFYRARLETELGLAAAAAESWSLLRRHHPQFADSLERAGAGR